MRLVGTSLAKIDNAALATGAARYVGDLVLPGMLHARLVRSPLAHARVRGIDTSSALAARDVVAVLTGADAAHLGPFSSAQIKDMRALALDRVRFVGDPVAAVVATSVEAADEAAALVELDLEPLPILLDPERSLAPGAPTVHDGLPGVEGNVAYRQVTRVGDIEAAFATADLVVRERFRTSKAHAMPMETHGALASWDATDRTLTVWSSTQMTHILRETIAEVFALPSAAIRVIKPFVGGAFGHKEGLHPHEAVAILASIRTGRPVRAILDRREEFSATVSRNPQVRDVELALRADGEILGWRERIVQDCGAYSGLSPSVLALSEWVTVGPYRTPALDIDGVVVYTNTPPASAFRGFGNPQATFTRELMFDIAARRLGLSPAEFRRRNLIREADLPTTTANGLRLRTLPIETCQRMVEAAVGIEAAPSGSDVAPSAPSAAGDPLADPAPLRGVGLVNMIEWGGGCRWHPEYDADTSSAQVSIHPDGSVVVATDAADSGQGQATTFTQIACDALGVEPDAVRVVLADTASTPYGQGTYGSRSTVVQGSALVLACRELRDRLAQVAAHQLEANPDDLEFAGGQVTVRGTDRGTTIAHLAASVHYDRSALPPGWDAGALVATASYDTDSEVPDADGRGNFAANYTCSSTAAVVEVDPETGRVTIVDWATAEDVGRAINPDLVTGQLQGGLAQGIGYGLGEDLLFDEDGQPLNATMADYQVPTAPQIPLFEAKLFHVESHDPTHPLGQKGIGESGITPAAAAIACAVYDAIGVPITSLPITPEKVLAALRSGR